MVPAWVEAAASLPVAFAQVREDPRIDLELCSTLEAGATVVMIASGGDTAICLSRLALGRLLVVDMNASQLALTRCKWQLARQASQEEAMAWLGHLPMDGRVAKIRDTLEQLGLPSHVLGPLHWVGQVGADFVGRYEQLFAALRVALASHPLEEAFAQVMSLENLVALFGRLATQNPRHSFAGHFAGRTRLAMSRPDSGNNPFLSQILSGTFPPDHYWDWLSPKGWGAPMVRLECFHGPMLAALLGLPEASADLVHLSNVLDWLSAQEACELLQAARRALKVGGRVIVRQLNSSLDIPRLPVSLSWDLAAGVALEARDRSFFYPHLHLGTRQ